MAVTETDGVSDQFPSELIINDGPEPPIVVTGVIKQDFGPSGRSCREAADVHKLLRQVAVAKPGCVAHV
jgi:hypothetical protein